MNLLQELRPQFSTEDLSKLSHYIASSEMKSIKLKNAKTIYANRASSKCEFYKSNDMDVFMCYKPISRLINFETWDKNEE